MDRDFLFRFAENQKLERREEIPFGCCKVCGRDIYRFEILNGYAVFDSDFYCSDCMQKGNATAIPIKIAKQKIFISPPEAVK